MKREGAAKMMKFFGKLPGQTIQDFKKELDALSDESYQELHFGIENGSLTY